MGFDLPCPRRFRDGGRSGAKDPMFLFLPLLLGRRLRFHTKGPGIGEVDEDRLELPFGQE